MSESEKMSVKRKKKQDVQKTEQNSDLPYLKSSEQDESSLWHDPFVHTIFIIIVGFIAYTNSLMAPFFFDDYSNIVDNPTIKNFRNFHGLMEFLGFTIDKETVQSIFMRPVGLFTFAANYAIHGLNHFGFHITNLLIHICNALMVYLLFFKTLTTPFMISTASEDSAEVREHWYLPLFAALIFISHPIQTQSVTYIVQRYVPLATFFYLGALLLFLIGRTSLSRKTEIISYTLSFIAAILAMGSKEIAFTLPVVVLLYEFMFFEGKAATRFYRIIPIIMTMGIIPLKLSKLASLKQSQSAENMQAVLSLHDATGTTAFEYLFTQFGVIVTYIRLLFFPVGQNLDYDYHLEKTFFSFDVILPLTLLLSIVAGSLWLLFHSRQNRQYRIIAFGIFWFFITLSVESSVIPIRDLIFEHRIYLPSIGFFMALLTLISVVYHRYARLELSKSKVATISLVSVVIILSSATIARNRLWNYNVTMWRDVVSKSPNKARAHSNLGFALASAVKYDPKATLSPVDAIKLHDASLELRAAIRINPQDHVVYANLAEMLILQKKYEEAFKNVDTACGLRPEDPFPIVIRGQIFAAKDDQENAIKEYRKAISLNPQFAKAHLRLSDALEAQGNKQEATKELDIFLRLSFQESLEDLKNSQLR